jgi:hypothetical protein
MIHKFFLIIINIFFDLQNPNILNANLNNF